MAHYTPIAETDNFIVLDRYEKYADLHEVPAGYQTEHQLEDELVADLQRQGYEYVPGLTTPAALLDNARTQLEALNAVTFTDAEWERFVDEYLDPPGEDAAARTRKVQDDPRHDFVFDGTTQPRNIALVDKRNPARNKVQVIRQFEQTGKHANRYDVTILVNGLPMVQVELKKRGVAIREAFNQVHRYSRESFNGERSLFKYLQLFVISNGTDTRYFANTTKREKGSFDFTMRWARADNTAIRDLKDFTATFFARQTLLQVLLRYAVFTDEGKLLVMRPYQIAAAERILWKIRSAHEARRWSTPEGGGYVWHTTGSGKTLTSFKAARLATELDFVKRVFFVVDRKDLDYQTMREYRRFSPESVNGSVDTAHLKAHLMRPDDKKIVVTTLQKLNRLMKSEAHLPVYDEEVVFIFDECHRSQFGEAQRNLRLRFKRYYQFGFTGTPIFPENALGADTTASVFGRELHSYVITDAIRDEKVLKFKVDYNDVRPRFKAIEAERDEEKLSTAEYRRLLLHPDRIGEIARYITDNFRTKTHRRHDGRGFNAMFAVSSVEAAKRYYEELRRLQREAPHPLRIATIFSFAANEAPKAVGEIADETFEPTAMDSTAKEFLVRAIDDYNAAFGTRFGIEGEGFQNYYRDLSLRVKRQEVDLLIVVGMFLTGFDAPTLNTLFVDKNLRYHGLIQAFSRTNRIYDATKTFGNIVTFRDLEHDTVDAITLFGDKNTKNVVLEKSFDEYMHGFTDAATGEARRGFAEIVQELHERFPRPDAIEKESDKKAFVKLFGEYLKVENILQNYDEFTHMRDLAKIKEEDPEKAEKVAAYVEAHGLTAEEAERMRAVQVPEERELQDYRSVYNDIREWRREQTAALKAAEAKVDWDDVVFEVELLKSQEINLDYILELIFEHHRRTGDKAALTDEVRRMLRADPDFRAKEELMVDFLNEADLEAPADKAEMIEAFYTYALRRQEEEVSTLIAEERLDDAAARRFIRASLRRGRVKETGTDLSDALPKMNVSRISKEYKERKRRVRDLMVRLVEKFKGIVGREA